MTMSPFIGREPEIARLKGLLNKKSASLIVVRGRRRIGKSRLLAEFGKEMKSFFFSGMPPVRKMNCASFSVKNLLIKLKERACLE